MGYVYKPCPAIVLTALPKWCNMAVVRLELQWWDLIQHVKPFAHDQYLQMMINQVFAFSCLYIPSITFG